MDSELVRWSALGRFVQPGESGMNLVLCLSAALWIAFLLCWFKPWTQQDHGDPAESSWSRFIHLSLYWISLVISLALPFGPLGWRWLPKSQAIGPIGLAIQ